MPPKARINFEELPGVLTREESRKRMARVTERRKTARWYHRLACSFFGHKVVELLWPAGRAEGCTRCGFLAFIQPSGAIRGYPSGPVKKPKTGN
jgi:hypothetical protein